MNENIISNNVLDKLEEALRKSIPVTAISRSESVMHVETSSENIMSGELAEAMKEVSLKDSDYDVLLEYTNKTCFVCGGALKFVNYGDYFINEMLVERFGGTISGYQYWVLYDETGSRQKAKVFGYKGDHLPTAEEVIQYIEELRRDYM